MRHLIHLESHVIGKTNRRVSWGKYRCPPLRKSPDFSFYCYEKPRLAYDVYKHD